jgi:hypothetical protein
MSVREKDFRAFFRTDPGFSCPQDLLATLLITNLDLNPHWRHLLELPFDATAELDALRDAELPLELLEVLQREAATQ